MTTQKCRSCQRELGFQSFHRNRNRATGYCIYCRECSATKSKQYRSTEKGRRSSALRRAAYKHTDGYIRAHRKSTAKQKLMRMEKYGLPPEKFLAMIKDGCQICGAMKTGPHGTLQIDHDHATGKFRGILCVGCNRAIGFLQDSAERADAVANYLRTYGGEDAEAGKQPRPSP